MESCHGFTKTHAKKRFVDVGGNVATASKSNVTNVKVCWGSRLMVGMVLELIV